MAIFFRWSWSRVGERMPSGYKHSADGKIHTRYSELNNCTMAGIRRVIAQRYSGVESFSSDIMKFGTLRHEMLAEESRATGLLPAAIIKTFPELADIMVDMIEEEVVTEIFEGIVLHSTVDAVSKLSRFLVDHKTITDSTRFGQKYMNTYQHKIYAYQLLIRGIKIDRVAYIGECWNKERTVFNGYHLACKKITPLEIAGSRDWLKGRCQILRAGIEAYEQGKFN